jgi:hypothetical protein
VRRASNLYARTPRAFKREMVDCSVRALMIAADTTYELAHEVMRRFGREDRRRTPHGVALRACLDVGMVPVEIDPSARPTLAQFIRAHRKGRYFLSRNGHSFALVDGVVHDWRSSRTGPRSRIKRAYRMP